MITGFFEMDWVERVRELMRLRQMTQLNLADKSGYSAPGLNRLLNGKRNASHEALTAIAEALGTTVEYLKHGIDRPDYRANVNAVPCLADSQIESWQSSPDSIKNEIANWTACPNPKAGMKTFAYQVTSDDMFSITGLIIPPGAIVFVDPDTGISQGETALFMVNGQAVIREARQIAGEWMLSPSNAKYQAIPMTERAAFVGRVVGVLQLP
ncbi:LexA family transcriptional regulator [Endozoicomonas sp. GU-1]|uniref:helix-turn-helix domain-containing protein n=1 Tax=Endozoicomonas sp. GU-1 TaxID=3009078 RepID=UPI0022B58D76|nr:LexA family transcriptional regulator [Endozoicomonas sp. GU-1]WBA79583.1 LexA family transcriptional regulator [Endozoicomonas sp. GU-1]